MTKKETNVQVEIFEIPDKLQVFDDPRTRAKTIALPFQFPDGVSGILMISKLQRGAWKPSEIIKKVTITYNE